MKEIIENVKVLNKGKGVISASKIIRPGCFATIPAEEAKKLSAMYKHLNIVSDKELESAKDANATALARIKELEAENVKLKKELLSREDARVKSSTSKKK